MSESENPLRNEIVVHPTRTQRPQSTRVLYLEPLGAEPTADDSVPLGAEYWRMFRQGLPWIIGMLVLGSIVGFVYSARQTPLYQARVTLEIDSPEEAPASLKIGDLSDDGSAASPDSYLPTQAMILQSRTLQKRAFDRLKIEKVQGGVQSAGNSSSWRQHLGLVPKSPAGSSKSLPGVQVTVKVTPATRIVEILCDSTDPQVAAAYGNTLANEYIDSNLQARWDAINHARDWLAKQLDDTRTKLQNSEDQLQAYGRESNLMFTGDKESVEQDKLKQIQDALSTAQADRIAKQSEYQIASSTPADSVPQVIDNARLSEYQSQLADLRRQLAELSSQYTPEHPKVIRIQAQIDEMQETFKRERDNVLTRIRDEYQSALMREKLLNSAYQQQAHVVTDQTQKSGNYNILERDVETNRQLYDTLLQKSREADIATAMRGSNVRIIDAAMPPAVPFQPNIMWNTLLASLSGFVMGLGFILVREHMDRSFKSPGEVPFHLKLPELGVIPEGDPTTRNGGLKSPALNMMASATIARGSKRVGEVELAMLRDKSSPIAESFRSALTSVLHSPDGGMPRVILISSAVRGEGKTTIVSNLGIALAEINHKVLLIDGDMRKPRLNEIFNVSNDWGLSDLLREKSSLRDCPLEALVRRTEMPDLSILTSGPGAKSISNLLYSHRMLELLQRFRCEFDNILIDTPPMLDISDARVLGRLADAAILVFRAGKTNRETAMAAKRRLTDDGIPVLGTILNAWDLKNMGRYGGYGAYEYYYEAQ